MFSVHTNKLRQQVRGLIQVVKKNEQIRSIVAGEIQGAATDTPLLELIKNDAPEAVDWKIYDHSAGFTRLYALFEAFTFAIVEDWLSMLPELYSSYSLVPEQVRNHHRIGVGQILTKLGGDQYQHLSEEKILKGISSGLFTNTQFSFLEDAFYTEMQNLWPGVLAKLFQKVGVDGLWNWVSKHNAMLAFLRDYRGDASSAEAELKSLVQYRNLAAHGDISEVVGTDELSKVAEFVISLAECMAQLLMCTVVSRKRSLGQLETLGSIIHNFSKGIVGVNVAATTVSVGDTIIAFRDNACHYTLIESIQANRQEVASLTTQAGQKIALKITRPAKVASELLRFVQIQLPDPAGAGI